MKSYRIKAANEAGRWSYMGIFASSFDALMDAMDRGAIAISIKPMKAPTA